MAIEIGSIGYNHKHEKGFYMDMPSGPGAYLFLLIKSPAIFKINGKIYSAAKNSFLIINRNTPCFYKSYKESYIDDWFYFGMAEDDIKFLSKLNIPFDIPIKLSSIEDLSSIIHRIAFEHFSSDSFHSEIKNHLTQIFFYELSRVINSEKTTSPDLLSSKNDKITYLRTQLFQNPTLFANINEMANFMNLSRSGFQHLYNNVFGHSVIKDVVSGRIEKAQEYLRSTNLTISEIAVKCGYKTDYHFMRQFKNQTGRTPTEYRNSDSWNQIKQSR